MTFDLLRCWQIFQENIAMFMSGVQVTLIYAIIGTVAGFIIGLILGGIRAVIRSRGILIDQSFDTKIKEAAEGFVFHL